MIVDVISETPYIYIYIYIVLLYVHSLKFNFYFETTSFNIMDIYI